MTTKRTLLGITAAALLALAAPAMSYAGGDGRHLRNWNNDDQHQGGHRDRQGHRGGGHDGHNGSPNPQDRHHGWQQSNHSGHQNQHWQPYRQYYGYSQHHTGVYSPSYHDGLTITYRGHFD